MKFKFKNGIIKKMIIKNDFPCCIENLEVQIKITERFDIYRKGFSPLLTNQTKKFKFEKW